MGSFRGSRKYVLYRGNSELDIKIFRWEFKVCSSATANDEFLPYGTTISTAELTAVGSDGTAVTSIFVGGDSLANNVVSQKFTFPDEGAGTYTVYFKLTLDDGQVLNAEDRVYAEEL